MNKVSDNEVQEIKSKMTEINHIINISGSTFRLVYRAKNFWRLFLFSGIISFVLPAIYYVLLLFYSEHTSIPNALIIVFYAVIFICWMVLFTYKTIVSTKAAKRLDIKLGVLTLTKELLSTRMWITILPVIIVLITIPIKYSSHIVATDYVPYIGIVVGLILNLIGVMIHEKEYSLSGCWMILTGLITFLAITIPVYLGVVVIFSVACFIFVISYHTSRKIKRKTNV